MRSMARRCRSNGVQDAHRIPVSIVLVISEPNVSFGFCLTQSEYTASFLPHTSPVRCTSMPSAFFSDTPACWAYRPFRISVRAGIPGKRWNFIYGTAWLHIPTVTKAKFLFHQQSAWCRISSISPLCTLRFTSFHDILLHIPSLYFLIVLSVNPYLYLPFHKTSYGMFISAKHPTSSIHFLFYPSIPITERRIPTMIVKITSLYVLHFFFLIR